MSNVWPGDLGQRVAFYPVTIPAATAMQLETVVQANVGYNIVPGSMVVLDSYEVMTPSGVVDLVATFGTVCLAFTIEKQ